MKNTFSPGSLARLNGDPVTIVAQAGNRMYYIPGFHFWTAAYTKDFTHVDREELR